MHIRYFFYSNAVYQSVEYGFVVFFRFYRAHISRVEMSKVYARNYHLIYVHDPDNFVKIAKLRLFAHCLSAQVHIGISARVKLFDEFAYPSYQHVHCIRSQSLERTAGMKNAPFSFERAKSVQRLSYISYVISSLVFFARREINKIRRVSRDLDPLFLELVAYRSRGIFFDHYAPSEWIFEYVESPLFEPFRHLDSSLVSFLRKFRSGARRSEFYHISTSLITFSLSEAICALRASTDANFITPLSLFKNSILTVSPYISPSKPIM